jgi:hypothetical protein
LKNNENKGSQMGHTQKIFIKIVNIFGFFSDWEKIFMAALGALKK